MNKCNYCYGGNSLWRANDYDESYITNDKLITLYDGYMKEININFCPMCGRGLNKGGGDCD